MPGGGEGASGAGAGREGIVRGSAKTQPESNRLNGLNEFNRTGAKKAGEKA
jgi:hypothetical protein